MNCKPGDLADLFGRVEPSAPFKDIRNTRPSAAEDKAVLVMRLGRLINTVPASVQNGSINKVRDWTTARAVAAKVAKNSRASVSELTSAISSMQRWL
jgi:hypothetical protein